jgi:predicted enzyme related to lactoylglutathione lyase
MLRHLRGNAADVAEETQESDGIGRSAWVTDPETNRLKLGQPA